MVAATTTATAQPAPPTKGGGAAKAPAAAADPKVAELAQHFSAGLAAADSKDWKKAFDEFSAAYAINPLPQIAGNLGEAELRLGRFRDAAEHIERFVREDKGAKPDDIQHGRDLLKEAKAKVATLLISVDGIGVDPVVFIDGKDKGKAPLPPEVYVEPGHHIIEARSGDLKDQKTEEVSAGWTRVVKLVIRAVGVAPEPTATGSGVVPKPPESPFPSRTVTLASGGVLTAAGLGIGIAGAVLYASTVGERDKVCTIDNCMTPGMAGYAGQKDAWTQLDNRRVQQGNMAIAGFVVAGLAAAGTGAVYFLWKPSPSTSATVQTVTILPTGAGAVVRATW